MKTDFSIINGSTDGGSTYGTACSSKTGRDSSNSRRQHRRKQQRQPRRQRARQPKLWGGATGGSSMVHLWWLLMQNSSIWILCGDIVGIDGKFAKAIAAKLGMELQIEDMAFGRNYSGSNKRKADFGAAGMTVGTEERQRSVEFYRIPYANSNQVGHCERRQWYHRLWCTCWKIIGVQLGTQVTLFGNWN